MVKIGLHERECALPGWLSVDPIIGSVPGGGSQLVEGTFDATGLEPGAHQANLRVVSDAS